MSCASKWLPFGAFSLEFISLLVQVSLSKGTLPKFPSQSVAQGKPCWLKIVTSIDEVPDAIFTLTLKRLLVFLWKSLKVYPSRASLTLKKVKKALLKV